LIVRNGLVVSAIRDIRIEQGWTVKNGISLAGYPDAFPESTIEAAPFFLNLSENQYLSPASRDSFCNPGRHHHTYIRVKEQ